MLAERHVVGHAEPRSRALGTSAPSKYSWRWLQHVGVVDGGREDVDEAEELRLERRDGSSPSRASARSTTTCGTRRCARPPPARRCAGRGRWCPGRSRRPCWHRTVAPRAWPDHLDTRRGMRCGATTPICATSTCATCSPTTPERGERLVVGRGRSLRSTTRRTASPTRRCGCCSRVAERGRAAEPAIDAMFAGEHINVTEDRAVLHVRAAGARRATSIVVDGDDVVPDVHAVLDRMAAFADRVRDGEWTGATGSAIRNVVNIGIGGSDLGPAMAYEALRDYSRPRADVAASCRTSTAPTLARRPATSTRRDAVHRRVEDVHDDRDDDQRRNRPRQWLRRALLGDDAVRQPLRGRVDERRGGRRRSASTPPTCSSSGTGSAAATRSTRRSACR